MKVLGNPEIDLGGGVQPRGRLGGQVETHGAEIVQ
jgi:hypothetical protein